MEEDIKKIEYFLNQADEYYDGNIDIKDCVITKEVAEAIENLIKEYKELDKENTRQHELLGKIHEKYQKDYIPKSKVIEKIEDYEEEIKEIIKKDYGVGFTLGQRYSDLKAIVKEYKELLQEGDDK